MEASPRRSLASGATLAASGRLAVAVTGAATTLLVARLLGPTGSGGFALALTVVLLLTTFGSLGVEHGIAFHVSGGRWAPADAMRSALLTAVALGVLGAVVAVGVRLAWSAPFGQLSLAQVAIVVAAQPFALGWFLVSYVALSVDAYEPYVAAPAVQSLVALVGVAVLATTAGLTGALIALTASQLVSATMTVVWTRRVLPAREDRARPERALRRAIAFGIKGYGANALQLLNYRLDLFVLAAAASSASVGHYAVAISVTSVMTLLPQALAEVLFPRVAALTAGGEGARRDLVEAKSLRHLALIVAVTGAVLALALLFAVEPVYGAGFRASVDLGLILLPGMALLGFTGTLGAAIVGRGRPGLSLLVAAVTTPLTIALYLVLIPALGATGAALSSTISYAATFALSAWLYRGLAGRPVLRMLVPSRDELRDYRALAARLHP